MCFQKVLNDEFIILNRLHLRSNEHNQSTFFRIINVSNIQLLSMHKGFNTIRPQYERKFV